MTIFGIEISMTLVWLIVALICLVIEGLTVGLATIWFAAGAIVTMLISFLDVPVPLQAVIFVVVSVGLLLSTRKIFVEKLKAGAEKTNVDAVIGEKAIVISPILPYEVGQVKIGGQVWSAVGKHPDDTFEKDQLVKITAVEGVKVIVTAVKTN